MEISVDLANLHEWLAFRDANSGMLVPANFDKWAHEVLANGCIEPLTKVQIPGGVLESGPSWREGLGYRGVGSRIRAVMKVMQDVIAEQNLSSPRIYATEGLTPFALRLRGIYPRFLGSEFTLDPDSAQWLYPIPLEDLQQLSLDSGIFDIVSTNEVLEHVPSIDCCLAEIARVLRPGGWHVGTVPFYYFQNESVRRTELGRDGELIHLLEPEYHGDPMSEHGVLVFEIPGWDILDRAKQQGFRNAFMRFMVSTEYGVVSEHIGGVLVFCCQK